MTASLRAEAIPEMEISLRDQQPLHKYGGTQLFAYLGGGLGFDNNVFLTHSNRKIGMFAFLIPGVRAKRDEDATNHIGLQFDYQLRGRRYFGEGNVDKASHIEHQILLLATWKPTKAQEWKFLESAAYLVDPVAADIPRQERFSNDLSAEMIYNARTTKFSAKTGLNIMRFSHAAFRALDRDNFYINLGADYHNLGPKADLVGYYRFNYFNNRDRSLSDLVVHNLLAGVSTPIGENKGWVYEIDLGLSFMSVVANRAATTGSRQLTGLLVEANAKWSQDEKDDRTFLKFGLRNEYQPAAVAQVTFSDAITLFSDGQYSVNKAITAGYNLQQQWIDQLGSKADLARFKMAAILTYHRLQNLSFYGRAEFIYRFGHFKADRYDDFRLLGGATYVF